MAEPKKVQKIDSFIRGDTPVIQFNLGNLSDGSPIDLTGYSAFITITPDQAPTSLAGALVAKQPMVIDGNLVSYQLTATISSQFVVDQIYYGDVELIKSPADTNTFTPIRFTVKALQDYGV